MKILGEEAKNWHWLTLFGGYCACGKRLKGNVILWGNLMWHPLCAITVAHARDMHKIDDVGHVGLVHHGPRNCPLRS